MVNDDKRFILLAVCGIFGIILFGFAMICVGQMWDLHFQPKIIVKIEGKEVYRGSNACIEEASLGSATHIQINKGFLCLFPGPKYTSKNVETKPL